jgi:hypothetical protein
VWYKTKAITPEENKAAWSFPTLHWAAILEQQEMRS